MRHDTSIFKYLESSLTLRVTEKIGFETVSQRIPPSVAFWEHVIRDKGDNELQVDYLHYNPGKHGYVVRVADWPYSSFHRYVERGIYPL
jgi:REP element-mobilizing transposase RayT